ncbi:hypothetical protein Dsin_026975 [Dipteronia sinensis]|uniref:Uncharacterized protein n=1 Tax=Dipteronia sinensis TaxID=43782 RepID=A0AAD9ZYM5_9ROSI|nr:hypothetical protein Dsin_026975 [Dipteronia sinensis]
MGVLMSPVTGITIQISEQSQCHLKFDICIGVMVHDMNPGDNPNTDGIHLQNSKDPNTDGIHLQNSKDVIRSSTLAFGQDLILTRPRPVESKFEVIWLNQDKKL